MYFGAEGVQFPIGDVRTGVWQKQPFGGRQICYCFGESEALIRAEIEASEHSRAVERIREHIAASRCACEVRNPRGACCLADVIAAVERVRVALTTAAAASPEAALVADTNDGD